MFFLQKILEKRTTKQNNNSKIKTENPPTDFRMQTINPKKSNLVDENNTWNNN